MRWGSTLAAALAAIVVIDGDTIELDGTRWRLMGYDTPETVHAQCDAERALGRIAAKRLRELVSDGQVMIRANRRATDRYGRRLGWLFVNGEDVGKILIREGMARPYDGRSKRKSWCAKN